MLSRVAGLFLALLISFSEAAFGAEPQPLAPGVVRVIQSQMNEADVVSEPFAIHALIDASEAWTPSSIPASDTLRELAKRAVIRRSIWQLEFGFKPMRMIKSSWQELDGTQREGLVWYLVYYVRNPGQHLRPVPHAEGWKVEYQAEPTDHAVRFLPLFVLDAHDEKKAYVDRTLPRAARQIQQREDPAVRLHNSVEISRIPLEASHDANDGKVWGVATWIDVDSQIDFFSVYVQGLTNAYQWQDLPPGELPPQAPPDLTRRIQQKTLQLNFYRPGDAVHQHEEEIVLGTPISDDPVERERLLAKYRIESPLEYLWIYR